MRISNDGNFIFLGSDDKIAFYEYNDNTNVIEEKFQIPNFKSHKVTSMLHITRNSRQELITCEGNIVCLWSHKTIPEYIMSYHDKDITCISYYEPNRILFTACKDFSIKVLIYNNRFGIYQSIGLPKCLEWIKKLMRKV
jgi:WD40 repeat protein